MAKLALVLIAISFLAGAFTLSAVTASHCHGGREARVYDRAHRAHKAGNWSEAINLYTQCIKMSPTCDMAYANRADVYLRMGLYDRAFVDADMAVFLQPQGFVGFCNRGEAAFYLGRAKEAVSDLTRAIEIDAYLADGEAQYYRSKALWLIGAKKQSVEDFECSQRQGYDPRFTATSVPPH